MTSTLRKESWLNLSRLQFLRLRPYGQTLATPAVRVWLGFAWVVILLMASIEGIVWGLVSASIVPEGITWLRPIVGIFMFLLMFSIIWIVDASLVMSERPVLRARRWNRSANQGIGALLRWVVGVALRVVIVAVSLYVTAPFLGKLIRADDIATYHLRQVEQYHAQREAALQIRIRARADQLAATYHDRTAPLEADLARLNQALAQERARRAQMELEYAPELALLRQDLVAARERVGNEMMGRNGRPEGRGPEARKWEANANQVASVLAKKQAEVDQRLADVINQIKALETEVAERSAQLMVVQQEQQTRLEQATVEVTAQQPEAAPPRLSFAARSKILHALRQSPDEFGVPHFETVEGFSQAALGVLFFALLALKLFEPAAVSAYFSETLQLQYRKYLVGGLVDIPGFEQWHDPDQRLNPIEFVRLWQLYEKDPAAFYTARQALLEVREPLLKYQAEQALDQKLLQLRQDNLSQEQESAAQRRDLELVAYDQELSLRTAQLKAQLDQETQAQLDHRRVELATELHRARSDWARQRAVEEENLRQQREAFEQTQRAAQTELQARLCDLDRLREQGAHDAHQREVQRQRAQVQELAELAAQRRREAFQQRLAALRVELMRLRGVEAKQNAEYQNLRQNGQKVAERLAAVREQVAVLETTHSTQQLELTQLQQRFTTAQSRALVPQRSGWWRWLGLRATAEPTLPQLERKVKAREKVVRIAAKRLAKQRDYLRRLEVRQLAQEGNEVDAVARQTATQARIVFYEDSLGCLLNSQLDAEPEIAAE
jgi:hypothetical protein